MSVNFNCRDNFVKNKNNHKYRKPKELERLITKKKMSRGKKKRPLNQDLTL